MVRTLAVVAISTIAAMSTAAIPASADLRMDDLPSAGEVRTLLGESGRWQRQRRETADPIGSRPSRCRSTDPFRTASQQLAASYKRQRNPLNRLHDRSASVTAYEFQSTEAASAAVASSRALADACSKSTEWYCTQCDGVITFWRTPVKNPRVGEESASWIGKTEDLGRSRYRTIVTRRGNLVVEITLYNGTPPGTTPFRFAKETPSRRKAVRLTREVLALAD